MNSIKVCEYSRSRSFHDDLILQDQASGERSQDHWSSGLYLFLEQWEALFGNVFFNVGNMRFRCEVFCLFFANMAQIVR